MSRNDLETGNILLGVLYEDALQFVRPHLSRIPVKREQYLHHVGERVETVYFPEGGVASCIAMEGDAQTEVGLVGLEGMTGIGVVLGDDQSQFEIFMQVNGTTALSLPTEHLLRAVEEFPAFRTLLHRYAHTFLLQVAFGLVSSAQHRMEARLARWLLMCHDRIDGDDIPLTHEFMAVMISAQRSGVTVTLHSLEGAGMIRSTRGLVTIRDRAKLEDLAGDSYGIPEARYRDLIGPFGK